MTSEAASATVPAAATGTVGMTGRKRTREYLRLPNTPWLKNNTLSASPTSSRAGNGVQPRSTAEAALLAAMRMCRGSAATAQQPLDVGTAYIGVSAAAGDASIRPCACTALALSCTEAGAATTDMVTLPIRMLLVAGRCSSGENGRFGFARRGRLSRRGLASHVADAEDNLNRIDGHGDAASVKPKESAAAANFLCVVMVKPAAHHTLSKAQS